VGAIEVDDLHRRAVVHVPRDQIERACGKDGDNQTLASQPTGWAIEVVASDGA